MELQTAFTTSAVTCDMDALEDQLLEKDEVVMYAVKVQECTKAYPHDFTACPWLHPGERARRRDPRLFQYSSTLCPDVKKEKTCARGLDCPYAHNIFEYFLHPDRCRTRMCDFGEQCTRKLCFFAHTPAQLRVTAKSLAAQQAQANSGCGKNGKGGKTNSKQARARGGSHSSSASDLHGGPAGASPAAHGHACAGPAAAAAADADALLAELRCGLRRLGADDPAAATTLSDLLQQLGGGPGGQTSLTLAGHSSLGSCDSVQCAGGAGTAANHGSQGSDSISMGSSPRTPAKQANQLSPQAGASGAGWASTAQAGCSCLNGMRAAGCEAAPAQGGSSRSSSGRLSVQEHIQAVMSGRYKADQPARSDDWAARALGGRGVPSPAAAALGPVGAAGSGAGAFGGLAGSSSDVLAQPAELFGLASPAALTPGFNGGGNSGSSSRLLGLQSPPMELLPCTGMQELCSPQQCFVPVGPGMSPGCNNPALLAAGDFGPLPASTIDTFGAGCLLQTVGSMDATQSAAGISGALAPLSGNLCGARTSSGLLSVLSLDSNRHVGTLDGLSPGLLQQSLPAQQQGVDARVAVLSSPGQRLGGGGCLPALASPAQAAAQQQFLQARQLSQQQALLLMQQQQAATAAAASMSGPVFDGWAGGARGVGSMLGSPGMGPGLAGCNGAQPACMVGLIG